MQMELFEDNNPLQLLTIEVQGLKRELARQKRYFNSRYNELAKLTLELREELDSLKSKHERFEKQGIQKIEHNEFLDTLFAEAYLPHPPKSLSHSNDLATLTPSKLESN